jgi:hypothetical protein
VTVENSDSSGPMTTYEEWAEVAQWFADQPEELLGKSGARGVCCPWCELAANSGGGPTDKERAAIVRRHRKRLSAAPFWPKLSAWLEGQP